MQRRAKPIASIPAPFAQRSQDAGLACPASAELAGWLIQHQLSLAFTTYRANRLLFLGVGAAGELKRHERLFDRPMGLYAHDEALWMTARRPICHLNDLALQDHRTAAWTGSLPGRPCHANLNRVAGDLPHDFCLSFGCPA
ncbi:DUF4915 domain-containing protein [Synechococcus sp. ATX 2A4]|uniref:DUF4915 domain-containing protein n=1 Tax=Synechococcus sp. ATX 2A4 TaxID=2823727 RepID=UPI0020CD21AE|nr:DUF4915 domain-containing protein [Synechococcus sp. ATX 2A4]